MRRHDDEPHIAEVIPFPIDEEDFASDAQVYKMSDYRPARQNTQQQNRLNAIRRQEVAFSRRTRLAIFGAIATTGLVLGAYGSTVWHQVEGHLGFSNSRSRQDPLCWVVSSEKYPTATAIAKAIVAQSHQRDSIGNVLYDAGTVLQTPAGKGLLDGQAPLNTKVGIADPTHCADAAKVPELDTHYIS